MIGRIVAPRLLLVFGCALAFVFEPPSLMFVQPRARVALAGPTGVELPVQVRVTPAEQNRALAIEWCDGRSTRTLDGENESALQPVAPLKIRVHAGVCVFTATLFGANGKQLARAQTDVRVCGGENGCDR